MQLATNNTWNANVLHERAQKKYAPAIFRLYCFQPSYYFFFRPLSLSHVDTARPWNIRERITSIFDLSFSLWPI